MRAGVDFKLEDDKQILQICSPRNRVDGPYAVVYKSVPERWAIVAFDWDGKPHLGIRWFWDSNGNPSSRGHATWLVIPRGLENAVLNGLPLDFGFRDKLNRFLSGKDKLI